MQKQNSRKIYIAARRLSREHGKCQQPYNATPKDLRGVWQGSLVPPSALRSSHRQVNLVAGIFPLANNR